MKTLIKIIFMIPFFAFASSNDITQNQVCFTSKISGFHINNFINDQLNVTSGQSFNSQIQLNNNCLTISANDKSSSDTLQTAKSSYSSNNGWQSIQIFDTWSQNIRNMIFGPSGLYFFAVGNLAFATDNGNYTCNVMLADGPNVSKKPADMWWFVAYNVPNFTSNQMLYFYCNDDNGNKTLFYVTSPQWNVFDIEAGSN